MAEYVIGEGVVYRDPPKETKKEGETQVVAPVTPEPEVKPEPKSEDAHAVKARGTGWVDKDEWIEAGKDPEDWRPAKEYNDRGELLAKIKSQSTEMKQIRDAVTALSEHNKQVYVAGYNKALQELKVQRAQAIENNDGKALLAIEDRMDETKEAIAKVKATPTISPSATPAITPAFQEFMNNNAWYNQQPALKRWAHGEAIEFGKEHPSASETEVYEHIAKRVREDFPEKFRRQSPPSLDGEGRQSASRASTTKVGTASFEKLMERLPEDQARVARDLVKRKYITAEKYVEDYESIGQGR